MTFIGERPLTDFPPDELDPKPIPIDSEGTAHWGFDVDQVNPRPYIINNTVIEEVKIPNSVDEKGNIHWQTERMFVASAVRIGQNDGKGATRVIRVPGHDEAEAAAQPIDKKARNKAIADLVTVDSRGNAHYDNGVLLEEVEGQKQRLTILNKDGSNRSIKGRIMTDYELEVIYAERGRIRLHEDNYKRLKAEAYAPELPPQGIEPAAPVIVEQPPVNPTSVPQKATISLEKQPKVSLIKASAQSSSAKTRPRAASLAQDPYPIRVAQGHFDWKARQAELIEENKLKAAGLKPDDRAGRRIVAQIKADVAARRAAEVEDFDEWDRQNPTQSEAVKQDRAKQRRWHEQGQYYQPRHLVDETSEWLSPERKAREYFRTISVGRTAVEVYKPKEWSFTRSLGTGLAAGVALAALAVGTNKLLDETLPTPGNSDPIPTSITAFPSARPSSDVSRPVIAPSEIHHDYATTQSAPKTTLDPAEVRPKVARTININTEQFKNTAAERTQNQAQPQLPDTMTITSDEGIWGEVAKMDAGNLSQAQKLDLDRTEQHDLGLSDYDTHHLAKGKKLPLSTRFKNKLSKFIGRSSRS